MRPYATAYGMSALFMVLYPESLVRRFRVKAPSLRAPS